jgi:hypothetical protein
MWVLRLIAPLTTPKEHLAVLALRTCRAVQTGAQLF